MCIGVGLLAPSLFANAWRRYLVYLFEIRKLIPFDFGVRARKILETEKH